MRRHLSYANVMATIAVFIALGGSSYALTISGNNIKNRSVTGADIKKNSLTGTVIKESSLSGVKRADLSISALTAKQAETAKKADTATTASTAANAVNAKFATNAGTAVNATTLGGLSQAQFLRSTTLLRGTGNLEALSPETILVLPALFGVKVTTDGDADNDRAIRIENPAIGPASVNLGTVTGFTPIAANTDFTLTGQPVVAMYSVSHAGNASGYTILCSFQDTAPKRVSCQAIPFSG